MQWDVLDVMTQWIVFYTNIYCIVEKPKYYTSNIKSSSLYQKGNRRISLFTQNIISDNWKLVWNHKPDDWDEVTISNKHISKVKLLESFKPFEYKIYHSTHSKL